ncbi:MAG TPA: hypothetical protein PLH94_07295 [Fimbriimonadaceae bacterium]|nr:hypothetical protein [Fimbriimonadaceae bacterium]
MIASLVCYAALVGIQPATYDPARHKAFLEREFTATRESVRNLETKKLDLRTVVTRLGKSLGDSRRLQPGLTGWMQSQKGQATQAMKLIQLQGLFEAYLSSQVLAIDGDSNSKTLAKALELQLAKLMIPPRS